MYTVKEFWAHSNQSVSISYPYQALPEFPEIIQDNSQKSDLFF